MAFKSNGEIAATDETVTCQVYGSGTFSVQLTTHPGWVGTVTFEGQADTSHWNAFNVINANTGQPLQTFSQASVTALFNGSCAGYDFVRVRATTVTSGTATCYVSAGAGATTTALTNSLPAGTNPIGSVFGPEIEGAVPSHNPVRIGGWDGTLLRTLLTDTGGSLLNKFHQTTVSNVAWTSATTVDAALTLAVSNYGSVLISFNPSGSITGGSLNFEGSDDGGSTYYPLQVFRMDSFTGETTFALSGATKHLWQVGVGGFTQIRVRLNPVITGGGTVNICMQASGVPLKAGVTVGGTITANAGTGPFNIQATAGSPGAVELSDGSAFYTAAKTGQLPSALVSGRLDVNVGNTPAVTIQATAGSPGSVELSDGTAFYTAAKTGQLPAALVSGRLDVNVGNDATVQGDVAHDGVDSGNPVKVGLRALAHGTNPTAVAAADRTDWLANRAGIPWVIGGHPNVVTVRANYTAAQTDVALVTVSTGTKIVVTRVTFTVDKACSVNVSARAGFGTANTPTTTGVLAAHPGIDPGGGMVTGDGSGILGVGADNEDLRVTCSVPTGGSIDCIASYYTIES